MRVNNKLQLTSTEVAVDARNASKYGSLGKFSI